MNWITSKLWETRSRLYRRRFLQVSTRWNRDPVRKEDRKALDEIYNIHILLHRSDLKQVSNICPHFLLLKIPQHSSSSATFWFEYIFSLNFDENNLSEFREYVQKMGDGYLQKHLSNCARPTCKPNFKIFFHVIRILFFFERAIWKRPSTVKCLAVKYFARNTTSS